MRLSADEERQFGDLLEKYVTICKDYLKHDDGNGLPYSIYKRKKVNEHIKVCGEIIDLLCWDGFSGGDLL